jgi:hypothetical protein
MRRSLAVVLLVTALAACTGGGADPFAELPDPDPVHLESTTSTTEVDLTGVPLAGVPGATTTSVVLGPGPATIVGHVTGPDGPVSGAVVELERVAGDGSASTKVPTAVDGTWNLERVLGGRYRIHAWKVPDLASSTEVVFIDATSSRPVDLTLAPVGGVRVDTAVAPDPPSVDEPVNLLVRVAERSVGTDGKIVDAPVAGVSVELEGSGEWTLGSANPSTTGGDGSTTFRLTCDEEGSQPLFATVDGGQSYALSIAACVDPDSTTTTTTTGGTSTSSTTTTSTTEP